MNFDELKRSTVSTAWVDTILIVDDNSINQEILEEHIQSLGFSPILAANGQEGLEKVKKDHPSLILLDILMPVMNGIELLKELKSNPDLKDIPVIMISAVGDMDKVLECIELGANDYLHKPIDLRLLYARIRSCINQKRDRDQEHLYRKQLENALAIINRQNTEIQNANSMITKYSRICSHELKNKLLPIYGFSHILLEDKGLKQALGKKNIHALELIFKNAAHMRELLNDAQDYQNILSNKIKINIRQFDINCLLTEALESYKILFHQKKIIIEEDLHPKLPMVFGDKIRVGQVFGNLLTNALKFSKPQTQVKIRTRQREDKVRIEVKDQGPGIEEKERDQIFCEHPRISNKPTGNEESTGLGLAIVKKLIELQGGKVGVTFPEKHGSVFWFELPFDDQNPVERAEVDRKSF